MRIGVLCSGGDSPGMNAAIRGAVLRGVEVHGFEMVGFMDGWRGFHDGDTVPLDRLAVRGISPLGGVMLGTSRVPPFPDGVATPEALAAVRARMTELGIDAFLLIGGNGTQTVAQMLDDAGIPVVGVPKTIDNDLGGTDYTFGFDTAVSVAAEAIDRLRTTGESHRRCMVLEVMGRDAGWIALHAGMAGGAQLILLPEFPESVEQICEWVLSVRDRGRSSLVVVAEGFRPAGEADVVTRAGLDGFGRPRLGGVAEVLAPRIEERTGIETRATVLGHVQRGGSPTAFDRVLATRTGIAAADAANDGAWGTMAGLHGDRVELVPLEEAVGALKTVPAARYEEARLSFG
ncbi:6-phosphofructokinase [Leucobacter chromiireducens]|uniref:ATP-dependent 6-phosphofructokinase n=1 Tax=Leucobacter chromiireducens subsp. chromiireducens TaxID=660067 RepID=A0ABS1SPM7_9MICO|nr:ATP-dependent 6-phosphofructokinase [Leucobacter chromiireducens]MBL3690123.1 6-phosphofructokinase [Leucobacter chromiireducens subsp. chromiireducens]